jgi:hypothetical protein
MKWEVEFHEGVSEKRFYRQLIEKADRRFDDHLSRIKKERT